jgi:hypothetical protein
MRMSDWLNNRLNERFANMDHPFDAEAAWQQLESNRKKKKRGFAWWWLGGITLGVILVLGVGQLGIAPTSSTGGESPAGTIPTKRSVPQATTPKKGSLSSPIASIQDMPITGLPSAAMEATEISATLSSTISRTNSEPLNLLPNTPNDGLVPPPLVAPKEDLLLIPSLNPKTFSLEGSLPDLQNASVSADGQALNFQEEPKKTKRPPSSLTWSGGYGITQAILSAESTPLASVQGVDHWQAGISYRRSMSDHFWLEGGIAYRQFTTKVSAQDTIFRAETQEDQLIQVIQYPDGTTEEIYGPLDVTVREITQRLHWQVHPSIEFQLLMGYQRDIGKHWQWSIGTGLSWGYMLPRRGIGQNPEAPGDWQDLSTLPYRNTTPVRVLGNTELGYRLNDFWGLALGVQGGMDLSNQWQPLSPDAVFAPVQQFRWVTGVIGIRYNGLSR